MSDLIIRNGDSVELHHSTVLALMTYAQKERELKEMMDKLKADIQAEMERKGIIKIDTDEVAITYIAPTARETFDKKKFKKDMPDIYDRYVDFAPVSASLRIKIKE